MKVRASVKKRSSEDKIVRRKGRIYIINKKNPRTSSGRDKSGTRILKRSSAESERLICHELPE